MYPPKTQPLGIAHLGICVSWHLVIIWLGSRSSAMPQVFVAHSMRAEQLLFVVNSSPVWLHGVQVLTTSDLKNQLYGREITLLSTKLVTNILVSCACEASTLHVSIPNALHWIIFRHWNKDPRDGCRIRTKCASLLGPSMS
jgi:hypothetical protein